MEKTSYTSTLTQCTFFCLLYLHSIASCRRNYESVNIYIQDVCRVMEIREMSVESIPSQKCQGIVKEIWSVLQCQGNFREICTFSLISKNGARYSHRHFSPLRHYLFCKIYMFEQRSTRSMINVLFVLLAKRVFTDVKNFFGGKPQTPSLGEGGACHKKVITADISNTGRDRKLLYHNFISSGYFANTLKIPHWHYVFCKTIFSGR